MRKPNRFANPLSMRGVVFIELAITLPIFIGIFLLAVELSHAISQYKVLVNQVGTGVRFLQTQAPGNLSGQRDLATCLVVTATPDCSGAAVLPGLTSAMVTIQDSSDSPSTHALQATGAGTASNTGSSINLVTVKVAGFHHSLAFGTQDITFSPISTTTRQVN